jgi:hypothetical protein
MGPLSVKCQVLKCHGTPENLTPDTELKSGRRDSNPRISAWKADALPLGDSRVRSVFYHNHNMSLRAEGEAISSSTVHALSTRLSHLPEDCFVVAGLDTPRTARAYSTNGSSSQRHSYLLYGYQYDLASRLKSQCTCLVSRNSSRPSMPSSRAPPEYFIPPNGPA